MTAQISESLYCRGEEHAMCAEPLWDLIDPRMVERSRNDIRRRSILGGAEAVFAA